jgi:hypothetical protein
MNNLYHLTSEDFFLDQSNDGKRVLCIDAKGLVLVCFHVNSNRCAHCEDTIPEFKRLPQRIGGCKFALANLSMNPDVIKMSNMSKAPIEHVPFIILYVNGRPFLRYEGERTTQDMMEFIQEVVQKLQSKQQFIEQKNFKVESEIPGYSVGIPCNVVCDEEKGVCYLECDDAYKTKAAQGAPRPQQQYPSNYPQQPQQYGAPRQQGYPMQQQQGFSPQQGYQQGGNGQQRGMPSYL